MKINNLKETLKSYWYHGATLALLLAAGPAAWAIKNNTGRTGLDQVFGRAYDFIFEGSVAAFVLLIAGFIVAVSFIVAGIAKAWVKGVDLLVGGAFLVGIGGLITLLFNSGSSGTSNLGNAVTTLIIPTLGG